jgi:hypothetical protein
VASCMCSAADLDDVPPLVALCSNSVSKRRHGGYKALLDIHRCRDVHGAWERVVGRLRHVDIVVWMNGPFAGERRACELTAAVRNDLIYVHVELRSASRHPHVKRKHVLMLAGENLITRLENEPVLVVAQPPAIVVGIRRALFQSRVRRDHLAGDEIVADAEVLQRALRLGAPQLVAGNIDPTQAVSFCANAHHGRINSCTHRFCSPL